MSENDKVQISVVIPAYNEERVIQATLNDVRTYLKKNYDKFEIIVVDDGSEDNTSDKAKTVPEVKVLLNNIIIQITYNFKRLLSVTKKIESLNLFSFYLFLIIIITNQGMTPKMLFYKHNL